MATLDSSPSKISGLSWTQFAEAMKDNAKDGDDDKASSKPTRRLSASLRLSKEDKWLYGFCPAQDEFYLVVCEACGQVVKPAALRSHIEQRHANMNSTFPSTPVKADTRSSSKSSKAEQRKKPSSVSSKSSQSKSKNNNCTETEKPCDKSTANKTDIIPDPDPPKLTVAQDRQEKGPPKFEIREMQGDSKEVILSIPSPAPSQDDFTSILISPVPSPSSSVQQVVVTTVHSSTLAINNSAITTISSQHAKHHKSAVSVALTAISPALDSKPQCSSPPPIKSRQPTKCLPTTPSLSSFKSSRKKSKQKDDKFIPCALREYDCDRHCGVLNADTKSSCTRSLTCKTHALSLRRAVPGRSKSFDILLKERKDAKEALLKAKGKLLPSTPTTPSVSQKQPPCLRSPEMPLPSPLFPPARIPSAPSVIQRPLTKLGPVASARIPPLPFNRPSSIPVFPSASPLLPVLIGDEVISSEEDEDAEDDCFISHAPRPLAVNSFGAWRQARGCYVFNRREDLVRSALAAALDRQLHPPPPKKLCVESSLPKAPSVSSDPYDFGPCADSNRSHNKSTPSNGISSSSGHRAKVKPNHLKTKSKSKHKARDKEMMINGQEELRLSSDDLTSPGLTSPQSCDSLTSPICNGINYLSRDVLSSSIPSPSLELPDQIFAGDSDQKPTKGQKSSQRAYSTSTAQQLAAAALNLSPHLGQELCGIYTAPKLSPSPAFTFQQKSANNKVAMQPMSLAIVTPGNMTAQNLLRQGDSRLKPRDITSQVQNSPSNVFS